MLHCASLLHIISCVISAGTSLLRRRCFGSSQDEPKERLHRRLCWHIKNGSFLLMYGTREVNHDFLKSVVNYHFLLV